MPRSVPEWVGATPDTPIPKRVKLRIWEREGGRCYLTGLKINGLKDAYEFEHVIALRLGGENRESNIKLALKDAHKAKTADDRQVISKTDRIRLKNAGLWPKPKRSIPSRQFDPSRPQPRQEA